MASHHRKTNFILWEQKNDRNCFHFLFCEPISKLICTFNVRVSVIRISYFSFSPKTTSSHFLFFYIRTKYYLAIACLYKILCFFARRCCISSFRALSQNDDICSPNRHTMLVFFLCWMLQNGPTRRIYKRYTQKTQFWRFNACAA